MWKRLVALAAVVTVIGCSDDTGSARTKNWDWLPEDLKDCKVYKVHPSNSPVLTVFRCPNSTTSTTTHEKSPQTTVVIDGVEYEPKKQLTSNPFGAIIHRH